MANGNGNGKFASRKFLFVVGIFAVASAFVCMKTINSKEWMKIVQWILLVYICGNLAEKYVALLAGKDEKTLPPDQNDGQQ